MSIRSVFFFVFLACLCVLVSGCAMSNGVSVGPATPATAGATIRGTVHGGQQPIGGATIQLYAANMTADQGASISLLTTPVTTATDGSGSFSITNDYMCPANNPPVYLVATGGNPGLGGSVNNTDIVLTASLGLCSTLSSSTYVVINEFSTIGMAYELAPFMLNATHIGSSTTNLGAMPFWFTASASFNNDPVGLASGSSAIALELNTFADILAACVNTQGGSSGDGSACGKLLQNTSATDTLTAAIAMTQSPATNAANLYALITGTPPFIPYFSGVPTDFANSVGYAYPATVRAGTLDSNGRIWLYTGGWTYDTVHNTSTDVQGQITVYDSSFTPQFTITPGSGGLYYPDSMAADSSGHVFTVNANNTISEFSAVGSAISPSGGWSTGITTVFSGTGTGDNYQDGSLQAGPIAIDSAGNIWGKVQNAASNCYSEMNSSGTVISPASEPACTTMGAPIVGSGAPDGAGNAWAGGSTSIVKVNTAGTVTATAPTSTGCFSPAATSSYAQTNGLAYDRVAGQVWGYSEIGAGVMSDGGTATFCDATPSTVPTITPPPFSLLTVGNPVTVNGLLINSVALDGAGNMWLATNGSFASGTAATVSTFNGTVNFSQWLVVVSPTGAILSPYNSGSGVYGYQPTGVGMNASANVTGQSAFFTTNVGVSLLGIDNSGNIWAIDPYTRRVVKISGLATANTVNY